MIKKKMAALLAVVLILVMVFPVTAFAYAPESEQTSAGTEPEPAKTEEATEPENDDSEGSPDGLESFLSDPDLLRVLLAGTDQEILEILKEHPKLIALLIPTLHVTVTDGSVVISTGSVKDRHCDHPRRQSECEDRPQYGIQHHHTTDQREHR